jgi:hypothetical protein
MDKEKIRKLWLKSREYKTILILDIIILILAIMIVIFYKRHIINNYTTIVLSLIIFISVKLTGILLRKRAYKFYSKYGINIRENKKR